MKARRQFKETHPQQPRAIGMRYALGFAGGQAMRAMRIYSSRQFAAFILFGGAAAIVNLVVGREIYATTLARIVPYWLATGIGSVAGMVVNFALNYFFNFRFRGRSALGQLRTFCIVAGIGTALTSLLSEAALRWLYGMGIGQVRLASGLVLSSEFTAHFVSVGLVTFYSFAAHRYFTFNIGLRTRLQQAVGAGQCRVRTSGGGAGRNDRIYWLVIATSVIFWLAVTAFVAPSAGNTDVYIFKDAGCNLALGRGFTATALPGMSSLEPRLFASYGPGLPLLYGLFASVFGCSGYSNTYFDLIVAAAVTLAFAGVVKRAIPRGAEPLCAALLGLALPTGLVMTASDRPEALGLLGFIAASLLVGARRPPRTSAAAFVAGLTTLVHPLAGAFAGLAAWALAAQEAGRFLAWRAARRAVAMIAIYAVPVAAAIVLYLLLDPASLARFAAHALGQASGAGAVLHNGYWALLRHAVLSSGYLSLLASCSSAIAAIIGLHYAVGQASRERAQGALLLALTIVLVAVPLAVFPAQNNYMALVRAILPVVIALSPVALDREARRRSVVALLIVILCTANLPLLLLSWLERAQTTALYDVARGEAAAFARHVQAIEPHAVTLVPAGVYFLYKPVLGTIVNPNYLRRGMDHARIGAEVACFYGWLPGTDNATGLLPTSAFQQVSQASSHYAPHLFGVRLTRREWGWSCDSYARHELSKTTASAQSLPGRERSP